LSFATTYVTYERHETPLTHNFALLCFAFFVYYCSINAVYALYWDIVMDWGMMQNPTAVAQKACLGGGGGTYHVLDGKQQQQQQQQQPPIRCHHGFLRPRLRFGLTMSTFIVIADSMLRFSWMFRFVNRSFPNHDAFVLCTQFLEVFRRAIWNLLRVEWENIKQNKAKTAKARDSLSDCEDEDFGFDGERERTSFLMVKPTNHLAPRDSIIGNVGSIITATKPVHTGSKLVQD
jgi:hypothetical protein